jgi:hypothetical protein
MEAAPNAELQEELQRFATQFSDRVTQASETLESRAQPEARDAALRKNLRYVSSAMEIATGPYTEVNLLDMIVFVRLCRATLERHWIPDVYHEDGQELAEVFARSEAELDEIAEHTLSGEQNEQLAQVIDNWLAENPDQFRVEGIRLSDFSLAAGSRARDRALKARGLLSGVKTATRAANQAMALSERGLFLAHRLPFVWRMQARLYAREVMGDAMMQLHEQRLGRRVLGWVAIAAGAGAGVMLLRAFLAGRCP